MRSDTYRLRHILDEKVKANKNIPWKNLYELIWYYRTQKGFSWSVVAYFIMLHTDIAVSGESLRRWCSDEKGRIVSKEKFDGVSTS